MFPLLYNCKASDIMLVEINPIRIDEVPTTARAIADRMNGISFNATMMREMRTIAFVTRMLDQQQLLGRTRYRRINFHMIQAEREMAALRRFQQAECGLGILNHAVRSRPRDGG